MARRRESPAPREGTASATPGVPPSLAEDPIRLESEARGGATVTADAQPKRGRKKKPDAAPPAPTDPAIPIEALTIMHREVWNTIARSMKSKFALSEDGARDMARYADLCIRQYLPAAAGQHTALAGYLFANGTALFAVLSMRETPAPEGDAPPVPAGVAGAVKPAPPAVAPTGGEGFEDGDVRRVTAPREP